MKKLSLQALVTVPLWLVTLIKHRLGCNTCIYSIDNKPPNSNRRKLAGSAAMLFLLLSFNHAARAQEKHNLQLSAGALYQQENFHWSIAGNSSGQDPNIYSELKWKNIAGPGYFAAAQWDFCNKFTLFGNYNQSYTHSGNSNDTDYQGDNRTNPVYDQSFSSDKGGTHAWRAGIGYMLLKKRIFSIKSSIGYGISNQSYYLVGNEGIYGMLNTSYASRWKGPFAEVGSQIHLSKKLNAGIHFTYNQVSYHADADWNLITGFQHPRSFSDAAKGYGINASAKLAYAITHCLQTIAGATYFNWQTGSGTDSLYLIDGETDHTQFNGAVRYGWTFCVGLSARW